MPVTEPPRYPGYDVLAKRDTPSWDAVTRRVIDERLATPDTPRFFTRKSGMRPMRCAAASCRSLANADAVSLVALLDAKLLADHGAGFREADMPYMREAWRQGAFCARRRGAGAE